MRKERSAKNEDKEEEGGGDGHAGDQGLVGGDAMRGLGAGTWRIGNFSSSLKSTAAHAALLRSIIYSKCNDDERGIVQQLLAKGDGDLKKVAKAIKKQRKGWGDGGDGGWRNRHRPPSRRGQVLK